MIAKVLKHIGRGKRLAGLAHDLDASIRRALAGQGHTTLTALDAPQLLQAVERAHPALVILDPSTLVEGNSTHICSELQGRPACQNTFMMVISRRDEVNDRLDAFAAGADDFLAIPFHMPELLLRVEALLRQARLVRPQAAADTLRRHGDLVLDTLTGVALHGQRRIVLTPVEARLLAYLMSCADRTVSAEELLQQVWTQSPGCGDPSLVRAHIRHLREKLAQLTQSFDVLRTVPRFGYCMGLVGAV